VVGSVDSGIKAAAWSPDEEMLVLVTGEHSSRFGSEVELKGQVRISWFV